jgi:hypothetical protein
VERFSSRILLTQTDMNPTQTMQRLIELGACKEAREWAKDKTAQECWEQCHRGDWLLWWAKKEGVGLRELTLAKGRCAETVIHLMKDQRSKKAVQAAIDYGNGLITDDQLRTAYADAAAAYAAAAYAADAADAAAAYAADAYADDAADAYAAAAYAADAYAADAAAAYAAAAADAYAAYAAAAADAYAAYAADAADAYAAAADDAYAAAAYADAAYADARMKAREENQKKTADIVRATINPTWI